MGAEKGKRLFPLDALRGLIIIFMALDHANYFIAQKHSSGEHWGGAFPSYDLALPALTRFITHLSAPGFFFLMGVGMLLFAESRQSKGWGTWKIIGHFWIRGALLIALQLIVVNRIWKAGPEFFPETYIGVLIALGLTMMIGGLVLRMPPTALLVLALGLLVGTEWLHPDPSTWGQLSVDLENLALLRSGGDWTLWSNYPALPWLELVVFGVLFGKWLHANQDNAYRNTLWIGFSLLVGFAVIRYLDGFGNIRPRAGDSWIDFLNVVKYPPSLSFTFLTMALNLLILSAFSRAGKLVETLSKPLVAFGREPLMMYLTHLLLYMLVGKFLTPAGTSIPAMFPYWFIGLGILYPLVLWFGRFKLRQPGNSLWRFV